MPISALSALARCTRGVREIGKRRREWHGPTAICNSQKTKQIYCGPLALTDAELFEAFAGFAAKQPDAGELRMGNAILLSLQDHTLGAANRRKRDLPVAYRSSIG